MSGDYKRLYRSREERMISGVCGGIAEYFEVDPTIIRLAFVLLALAGGGSGFIAYIILAVVIPEKPLVDYQAPSAPVEPAPAVEAPEPEEAPEAAEMDEPEAEV